MLRAFLPLIVRKAGIRALYQQSRPSPRRRQELQYFDAPEESRGGIMEVVPFAIAGVMLVAAFAFAGHYIGRTAQAHNATVDEVAPLVMPTTILATKGSLLPEGQSLATLLVDPIRSEPMILEGKGDLQMIEVVEPVPPPLPKPKPVKIAKVEKLVKITPASINLKEEVEPKAAVKRMIVNRAVANSDKSIKIDRVEKQKVVAKRRVRLAEENCLARAIYFEARSESDMGQLAVAKVILNRVKSPNYAKSICGVVYQGSGARNSCQFSFACDGQPDDVNQPGAWAHAKTIAQRAINNDPAVAMLGSATNYHADYVKPKWAKSLRRMARIGHHIFYSGG
jgi:spore germination cell wall hydrolase CwlJ-like protein